MVLHASKLFSVVIPTLNEGNLLKVTVDSILKQTSYPNYEVIIVDDGSTDGSCDPYKNTQDSVRVVKGGGLGVARARNLGAQNAKGEFIVFLDSHCKVSSNWLTRFSEALSTPDVALVGPCFTRLEEPEPRGCGVTWVGDSLEAVWFEPATSSAPYEIPLTIGACQAFRKSTFDAIGSYEQGFGRWGSEDTEVCLRSWLLGYRVVVDPEVVVAHKFKECRNYEVEDSQIIYNFLRMLHLHLSPKRIRRILKAARPPFLKESLDKLYGSDVFELRAELSRTCVYDDDWFFDKLIPSLR